MTDAEYLQAVLRDQTFAADSPELAALADHREEVEGLLKSQFAGADLTIQYGGSKAKGTMIKASYDLDLPAYFGTDDTTAGSTLHDIFHNVEGALRDTFWTEAKGSAIRLRSRETTGAGQDFHIDVVPGRYFDESKGDVWLYQNVPDRERLKTNLDVHIDHVKKSGVRDAIKLLKLWRVKHRIGVRNFVLELLVIDLLAGRKAVGLPTQVQYVFEQLRDNGDGLCVEDPANPGGNDLSELLNDSVKATLEVQARLALQSIANGGWERVYGPVEEKGRDAALARAAAAVPAAAQQAPWFRD